HYEWKGPACVAGILLFGLQNRSPQAFPRLWRPPCNTQTEGPVRPVSRRRPGPPWRPEPPARNPQELRPRREPYPTRLTLLRSVTRWPSSPPAWRSFPRTIPTANRWG